VGNGVDETSHYSTISNIEQTLHCTVFAMNYVSLTNFLLTTYLLRLLDVFSNRQSVFLLVSTVLLSDFFLYSYDADCTQGLLMVKKKQKDASPIT